MAVAVPRPYQAEASSARSNMSVKHTSSRHQDSPVVKESRHSYHLPSQLKNLKISHRHKPDDSKPEPRRPPTQSRHHSKPLPETPDDYYCRQRDNEHPLSPVIEQPSAEGTYSRHQFPTIAAAATSARHPPLTSRHTDPLTAKQKQNVEQQQQPHRTPTQAYRTITNVKYLPSTTPRRGSYDRHELDDTSIHGHHSASTSPTIRPPSIDGGQSIISSISSAMSAQTRSLPPVRIWSYDEARIQLHGLRSRLMNLESAYSVSKYGPPSRNDLKKIEKATASLARDCDYIERRAEMEDSVDALKGDVEIFWDEIVTRLQFMKRESLR